MKKVGISERKCMARYSLSHQFLALILSFMLVIGLLPQTAWATDYVAYIGTTGYTTLAAAVSDANSGDSIVLTADDDAAQKIEINQNLTIELDGYNLANTVFKISAGTVTIGDRKGTGTINGNHVDGFQATENSRCYSSIYITGSATVTLNNLRVEQCAVSDLRKAIFLGGSASLTINGGSYTGSKQPGVDAIFYYNNDASSSLIINDGLFEANCGLSVNNTPGSGGGTLKIRKATFVGNGSAFWIEQEHGGVTTQQKAERFLADSSGSYILGTFDQANIVIGSKLFVSDGFIGAEYGSTDPTHPSEILLTEGQSVTFLPQVLGGDGSAYIYTWYKGEEAISGASASSYSIENYQPAEDDGFYSVTVSQGEDKVSLYWKVGGDVSTPQLPGKGTAENPYEISTPEQLKDFAELVNAGNSAAYAVLTQDIDMSAQAWTGISGNTSYTGVFDGKGHTISNLTGTEGLFVNNAGTIQNVQLENVALTKDGGNLGAVVGINTGTVFNCVSSGSITGTSSSAYSIGGLIGHNDGGVLSGSSSSCAVSGKTAGGLVGSNWNDAGSYGQITACIYTGSAQNPVEGDKNYSYSTLVYYKDETMDWKSYPSHAAADEMEIFQSINAYIADNGGELIFSGEGTTYPSGSVSYLAYTENGLATQYITDYTLINSENLPTEWKSGWYVVDGDVTIDSRVSVSGDVKLILKNGANLTVNGGIDVSGTSNRFTVYAQSTEESKMGSLTATAADETGNAGIGSSGGQTAGAITIHGGKIQATGGSRSEVVPVPGLPGEFEENFYTGAGIGGGEKSACSVITINGGIVTAVSGQGGAYWKESNSAGIGNGGYNRSDLNYEVAPAGTIVIHGGIVNATSIWWGAGIGGGDEMPIAEVAIHGGTVTAQSDSSAGIGNGGAGDGGIVTITGGTVNAVSESACGIGGGYISDIEKVVITGGDITATSESGAGIGSCAYQTIAQVIISGGRVTATSNKGNGIGIGYIWDDPIDFSTGENGTAVIFTSSMGEDREKDEWKGLIFEGNEGKIYGDSYTVEDGLSIDSDKILTIDSGKTLIIPNGVSFDFAGEIRLAPGGLISGILPSGAVITYQIQWDTDGDGTMDEITYEEAGSLPTHENGSKEGDAQYTYTFTKWFPELTEVTGPAQYTALFSSSLNQYTVTLPNGEGYMVITSQDTENVPYNTTFAFTLTIKDGYSKTDGFAVKANGTELNAQADGNYNVVVTENIDITVEGVADITPPSDITVSYETDRFKEFLNALTFHLFFKDTITVTISATDEGSGVKEFTYQLGQDAQLQTQTAQNGKITFAVQPEFKGNIKNVAAKDDAGNASEGIDYEYFAIEKNKPTDLTVETNGYESGKWTNGDVTITVSGSTATSGIAKYQYSTDGGQSWHDMTATEKTDATKTEPLNVTEAQITVSNSGSSEYLFRAVSGAGNESTASAAVTVNIDKGTPNIIVNGDAGSYLQEDTVQIIPIIGYSGISKMEVQKDNGSWEILSPSVDNPNIYYYTVTGNGTYTFRMTNGAGATATGSITYDKIDSTKPVVSVNANGYTSGTWTNGEVSLSVSNTAPNLGTTTFQYSVDGGEWQPYTQAIVVSDETDGATYTFKAISASGVKSDEVSVTVKIDKTPPEGDIVIEENSVKKLLNAITFGLFYNKNVEVTITGTDNLSGVAAVEYYRSEEILTEDAVKAISEWAAYAPISETAEDAKKFVYYVKITDHVGNVTYFGSNGVTFDLTKPVIAGVTDGATYYTTQSVTVSDIHLESVTVNDEQQSGTTFTLEGNVSKTYTIVATDKAGNVTTYEVNMKPIATLAETIEDITVDNVTSANKEDIEAVKALVAAVDDENAVETEKEALQKILDKCDSLIDKIEKIAQEAADLEEELQKYDPSTITSGDKESVEQLKEELLNLINSGNLTDAEKEAIQEMVDNCDAMLNEIEAAGNAGTTENTDKVEDITSDNVKPEDKEDLTAAKEDLENALENFGENYTEEEKTALEEKLEQINSALESIEKAEAAKESITVLPDAVEPDDIDAEALINAVKAQYDTLSEHEKSLIPEELKHKLESLLENLTDYRIIAGNGSQWTSGDNGSISMTANGSVEKFVGIEVDGKAVDAVNYTVKSGSTIITLRPSYLNTLSVGKHTLTVIYSDGETSGEFEILKKSETITPGTGDNSNILLWVALLFVSGCALSAAIYRKKDQAN